MAVEFGEELSGDRVRNVLDRTEVGRGLIAGIADGASTLAADTVDDETSVLEYLQKVAKSEQGALYATARNLLRFTGRNDFIKATPEVKFTDAGDGVAYQTITVDSADETLYNVVTVTREGGSAVPKTVVNRDSIKRYGFYALKVDDAMYTSDSVSLSAAFALCNRYSKPESRIKSISVIVNALPVAQQAEMLSLDLLSVVDVEFSPPGGGDPIVRRCVVDGIDHDVSPDVHRVTYTFGDADGRLTFILDDPEQGVLNTNKLAW